jgi:hypothetical protein
MSDEKEVSGQRPNAKYGLSKKENFTSGEESLNFHYSRERRLANAPQEVKDLYKEKKQGGFNLFGPLVADKPRRVLLVVIIILCVATWVFLIMGFLDKSYQFDGNKIVINAMGIDGRTFFKLKKTAANDKAYTGAVDIVVSLVNPEGDEQDVLIHRVFFTMEKEELYSFDIPYEAPELSLMFQTDENTLHVRLKPD